MTGSWRWAGDRSLLREFPGDLEPANALARAHADAIRAAHADEVEDVIPGARSVLVVLRPGRDPGPALGVSLDIEAIPPSTPDGRQIEIGVRYDGEDLADVARATGRTVEDVVRLHTSALYTVAFIGFSPGFPYLLGLPVELHLPRRATPRTRVPAGSVAIAGDHCGIYPAPTPGGWHLLGSTDTPLFDQTRARPAMLGAGDRVRFVPER